MSIGSIFSLMPPELYILDSAASVFPTHKKNVRMVIR